ncbi:MAG: hypothetical protein QNJ22_08505 [Desulfosarcinaceae bacterium]|nr:hypothetical protein [Desulfosarcinaceae bacterium]
MNLSKMELQEMLREMGLKFSPDASYDELRQMFQSENHRRWLGEHRPEGPKRVIRRRRSASPTATASTPADTAEPAPIPADGLPLGAAHGAAKPKFRPRREHPTRHHRRTDSAPAVFDRQKNVFATVLRRAKRSCELCDSAAPEDQASEFLRPFYLVPLDEGGQEVIKNVVALCPECTARLAAQRTTADLKTLKRKARQKVISSVVVIRR